MDLVTHVKVARMIYARCFKNYSVSGRKFNWLYFLRGNLKPDIRYFKYLDMHEQQKSQEFIYEATEAVTHLKDNKKSDYELKLGMVCHFLTDYFCLYHYTPDYIQAHWKKHLDYELGLSRNFNKAMRTYTPSQKTIEDLVALDYTTLLKTMCKSYDQMNQSQDKDLYFCILVPMVWMMKIKTNESMNNK